MSNYIGYFRSVHNNILYSVKIISDMVASKAKEITLSGDEPFVVKYNESNTPFEPFRNSTATIKIVSDTYFEDILPSKVRERKVILTNEDNGTVVWCGYLTPKIYDMGYTECNEVVELEASDCISIMQYIDYEPFANKGVIWLHNVISRLCSATGLLKGFYFPNTKMLNDTEYLKVIDLEISERNFYSSDMEESWTLQEVLGELCKYLGVTAMQIGEELYFVDYTAYNNQDSLTFTHYIKMNGFENTYHQSTSSIRPTPYTITENDIMGSDSSISFEPIYNKVYVNCNMFACDDFIPNIFDDKFLINRNGDFYSSFEVLPESPARAEYRYGNSWGNAKYVAEETSDDEYKFFHRLYDNEYWESVYKTENLQPIPTDEYERYKNDTNITKNYVGGTILDLGTVRKKYFDKDIWQYVVANKLDYERYLCISQMSNYLDFASNENTAKDNNYTDNYTVYKLKQGFKSQCMVSKNAYMVIDFKYIMQRYRGRNYINPDWVKGACKGASGYYNSMPNIWLMVKIGDKYWNGSWWTSERYIFKIKCGSAIDSEKGMFNTEFGIINTVEWELFANEEGYKIPLNDVDTKQEIEFNILLPEVMNQIYNKDLSLSGYWNNYCWIKDFKISVVEPNQDIEREENDIVYENVIDEDNINELDEISLKITSYTPDTKPSYSNMGLRKDGEIFLQNVREIGLSGAYQLPEQNIIEKYYSQYSTPTRKISITVGNNISPLQKIYGADIDKPSTGYVQLGAEIDYLYDSQTITIVQKK